MKRSNVMTKWLRMLIAGAAALASSGELVAQTIATQYKTGTTFQTNSLTGFQTTGIDMVGMQVTARFSSGQTFTGFWTDLGKMTLGSYFYDAHGVSQSWGDVSLASYGDSNSSYWVLRLASDDYGTLTSLQFNGAPGRTLFDCRFTLTGCAQTGGTVISGTIGSSNAVTAQAAAANSDSGVGFHNLFPSQDVTGIYANSVNLAGSPAVGDLYEQFTLDFKGGMSVQDGTFLFAVDTDNASANTTIIPNTPVPEPSSLMLLAAGIGTLALGRRRRIRHA